MRCVNNCEYDTAHVGAIGIKVVLSPLIRHCVFRYTMIQPRRDRHLIWKDSTVLSSWASCVSLNLTAKSTVALWCKFSVTLASNNWPSDCELKPLEAWAQRNLSSYRLFTSDILLQQWKANSVCSQFSWQLEYFGPESSHSWLLPLRPDVSRGKEWEYGSRWRGWAEWSFACSIHSSSNGYCVVGHSL